MNSVSKDNPLQAEELLRTGRLQDALGEVQEAVRSDPGASKHRVFLFQLLTVMGQWDRAITQLNVAADMDPENFLMAALCRPALNCEALRKEIFAGNRSPLIFGEPAEWVVWLTQVLPLLAQGKGEAAAPLRDQAFEQAPAIAGTMDGRAFSWIADADPRLGPVLEVILEGRYYWVPFSNIREIKIEKPAELRDLVWIPAYFTWVNEGKAAGLIPVRYPGTEDGEDASLKMARRTEWVDHGHGYYQGLGQRMFATEEGEYPMLEVRQISLHQGTDDVAAQADLDHG